MSLVAGGILTTFLTDVAPVASVVGIGWGAGKTGFFSSDDAVLINRFVLNIAAPALVFSLMTTAPLRSIDPVLALGYLGSESVIYAGVYAASRRWLALSRRESLLLGMASCFVNHFFFVLPVAEYAYGADARAPIVAIIAMDSVVLFTGTVMILEMMARGRGAALAGAAATLSKPYVAMIFAGLALNLAGFAQPEGLARFTAFLGAAASPAALFALGIVLSGAALLTRPDAAWLAAGAKLVIHPLLAFAIFGLALDLSPAMLDPAMLVAAGPCGALAFALALQYGAPPHAIARAIVLSTLGSLIGLSLLI